MARIGTRPEQTQFSSLLQLVSSSPNLSQPDFKSMEDVLNFEDLSTTISDVSSSTHSFHSPLLRSHSVQLPVNSPAGRRLQKPKRRDNQSGKPKPLRAASFSIDHLGPLRPQNFQRSTPSVTPLPSMQSNICRDNLPPGYASPEAVPVPNSIPESSSEPFNITPQPMPHDSNIDAGAVVQTLPLISPPSTPRSTSFAADVSNHSPQALKSYARRKSLDLGPAIMQAGIRRLKRSSSMWTTSPAQTDESISAEAGAINPDVGNFRATTQMSEGQKLITVKRARKLAKVFGSQAPTNMIHGPDDGPSRLASHRDSISIILSKEALTHMHHHPEPVSSVASKMRRPSVSRSSTEQLDDVTLVQSLETTMSNGAEMSSPTSPGSVSTFRERRRRAAKLTQFFGVDYQELVPTVTQKPGSSTAVREMENQPPTVEVDIKVAGRRFWGFSDDRRMKTAEVADVIDQLRGLRAA